jgi:hypothetical protein
MVKDSFSPRLLVLLAIILLTAALRVPNAAQVTPWAHLTPIGAIALFGGAYFTKWKAWAFPLLALLLSDLAISFFVFNGKFGVLYGGWYWIYGIFVLIILLGRLIIKRVTVINIVAASVCAAVLHWLLSDLTVWLAGGKDLRTMLPLSRDINGLIQCYIQGLPFLKVFLTGTLLYSGIMFGVFEWAKKYNPSLQVQIAEPVIKSGQNP